MFQWQQQKIHVLGTFILLIKKKVFSGEEKSEVETWNEQKLSLHSLSNINQWN